MLVLKKVKKQWRLYPIGSPKGALNHKREPEFVGNIKFSHDGDSLSISRFVADYNFNDNSTLNEKLMPPGEVIKLLRSQAVFLATPDEKVEKFLKSLNIKVRKTQVCDFCAYEGNITIVNSSYSYKHNNQLICKDCAYDTIKQEIKLQGFDKKIFRNLKGTLEKTGSLEKTLSVLDPHFDPIKNRNLTLFDKTKKSKHIIPPVDMKRLKIPKDFKQVLLDSGNTKLLPVQYLAIKEGLLKGEDLLVVSATGSGKTLVGELAGITEALKGKKFIFLTPLVALANQKYRDFKKKYRKLGLKVAIKVGRNRVKAKGELKLPDSDVSKADIVVATYEGIDYLLRNGNSKSLSGLGVVLIDEIHMIDDEDRGTRLNGLIKRLKNLYPKTQIISLSATVKNPEFLASEFNMKLVQYSERPVPLERHLVYVRNESQKRHLMRNLVQKEFHTKSKKGFRGQTIIFTNSRRKTHQIANYLNNKRVNAQAYHAGLSYYKKEKIEKDFDRGKISCVVTTAALAAGVDFPASQVIFDSLVMGNKWINPNEFSQMLGRAGRPSYHDRGIVYLLPEVGNDFAGESEEAKALDLLESNHEDVYIEYDEESAYEQILADISSTSIKSIDALNNFYKDIDVPVSLKIAADEMEDLGLISISANNRLEVTNYGRATSVSFLSIEEAEFIKNTLNDKEYLIRYVGHSPMYKKKEKYDKLKVLILAMALDLEMFENAYLSSVVHNQISNALKIKFSTRLFAESTLDIISSGEAIEKVDKKFQDALIALQTDFMQCNCQDRPFCSCMQRGISEVILNERLKGKDPQDISNKLFRKYQIQVYPGDIFSWLDNLVKNLDAIKRISKSFNKNNIVKKTNYLIKKIENG
ncbi:MAG: DEAD/DEAH box helicase [Methanobrevibacter sp.]|uniref:DEAD/DEAH box helicase n=1 Tax=Methanobrevibacter sp. TaxID=66852 RepID=UPI0025DC4F74|nr:DEAD/DEAH box helicase [Methanobrevibacter sp.]MBR6992994.1 DEAD/DEAH box helicase [Methanobrevibacter sp.]